MKAISLKPAGPALNVRGTVAQVSRFFRAHCVSIAAISATVSFFSSVVFEADLIAYIAAFSTLFLISPELLSQKGGEK